MLGLIELFILYLILFEHINTVDLINQLITYLFNQSEVVINIYEFIMLYILLIKSSLFYILFLFPRL